MVTKSGDRVSSQDQDQPECIRKETRRKTDETTTEPNQRGYEIIVVPEDAFNHARCRTEDPASGKDF